MLAPIGDRFDEGGESEVGRSGALGDEHLGSSACDVVLEERGLTVEGLLLRVEVLLG